jgi:fido (protein-threonine AMPylation protein)
VESGWPTCKDAHDGTRRRLCQLVDPATLARHPRKPIAFYLAHEQKLAQGSLRVAARFFNEQAALPKETPELLTLVRSIHETLFSEAEPSLAGTLRTTPVWFGGEGLHQLEGAPPDEIEDQLHEVLGRLPIERLATLDRHALAHHSAVFLEGFFRIHPFDDGNGRVGRLFVELAVYRESSRYRLRALGKGRKYRRALEYAHRHAPASVDPLKQVGHCDPWTILADWIEEFSDAPPGELDEIETAWSTWSSRTS